MSLLELKRFPVRVARSWLQGQTQLSWPAPGFHHSLPLERLTSVSVALPVEVEIGDVDFDDPITMWGAGEPLLDRLLAFALRMPGTSCLGRHIAAHPTDPFLKDWDPPPVIIGDAVFSVLHGGEDVTRAAAAAHVRRISTAAGMILYGYPRSAVHIAPDGSAAVDQEALRWFVVDACEGETFMWCDLA